MLAISYTASGGGRVTIQRSFKPYELLGVATGASRGAVKDAFKGRITQASRQQRAMSSLAYYALTSTPRTSCFSKNRDGSVFKIEKSDDHFLLAAVGDTKKLTSKISRKKALLNERNEHNHTILYLAARNGFYDTTEALLAVGALVNEKQVNGSTALHGASFYGHRLVVELLLQHGANPVITNQWGNTAEGEASSDEIRAVIRKSKDDNIASLARSLIAKGLAVRVQLLKDKTGKVVGKEIVRNEERLDYRTRRDWSGIKSRWETAWHGTKHMHLESIFQNGLLPSGAKLPDGTMIKPPFNHYKLGECRFGVDNWANATFLSPSILYSSHVCYAERVFSESERWCVVVKACVEPSSYQAYDPTVLNWKPIDGEPENPEYSVRNGAGPSDSILRVESARKVVVMSVVFVSLQFLEHDAGELEFDAVKSLFK